MQAGNIKIVENVELSMANDGNHPSYLFLLKIKFCSLFG